MPDFKTLVYSLTKDASLGNFQFLSSSNTASDILLNNGANWSNQTANITPQSSVAVNILNIAGINYGAVGAVWYFGSTAKFDTLDIQFSNNTSTNATRTTTWEYWNGSVWTVMDQTGSTARVTASTGAFAISNATIIQLKFHPDIYNNWLTTTVNGGSALYYIRCTIGVAAFTTAAFSNISIWDHYTNFGFNNFDKVYTTVDDVAFTDVTLVARSTTTGAFTFISNTTNARFYIGLDSDNLSGFRVTLSTAGTTGTGIYEYWNGSTWTALSYEWFGLLTTGNADLVNLKTTSSGFIIFKGSPAGWVTSAVDGVTKYWIRYRVTLAYVTQPIFSSLIAFKDRTLTRTVYIPETSNRSFKSVFAKIHFYNPLTTSLGRFIIQGRLGSGSYIPATIGTSNAPTGTFSSVDGKLFSTTSNDAVFTDETSDASTSGGNDVTVTNTVNSNIYFGFPNDVKWKNNVISLAITPNNLFDGGVVIWEYWNGSSWTAFTPIVVNADISLNQKANTVINVQIPLISNWVSNTVNSFTGYFIRRRITTIYSTATTWSRVSFNLPITNETQWTNTGENNSNGLLVDLTSLFTSQFSGVSQQLDLKVAMESVNGILGDFPIMSGELYITYAADNQITRIKTVIIPLDSSASVLTGTLTSIGSNQIPQLSTYLPEALKTIRNFYIVFTGEDCCSVGLSTEFAMRLDSDAARYTWGQFSSGLTGNLVKYIFTKDDIATGSTHDIQMAITARNTSVKNWQMYAVVTYEYDSFATERVINSLMLPFETSSTFLSQDNPLLPEKVRKSFYIQEPGIIDNERIGCYLSFTDLANPFLNIKEMNEANFTAVSWIAPSTTCGGFRYSWRLPSQNLSRGLNTIGVDMYGNAKASAEPSCAYTCGYFLVNYRSDIATTGIESHNKMIMCMAAVQNMNIRANRGNNNLTNPFTNWFLNDFGLIGEFYQVTNPNTSVSIDNRFSIENTVNTLNTRAILGIGGGLQDLESLMYDSIISDRDLIKKYPGDIHDHRVVDLFAGGNWFIGYGYFSTIGGMYTVAACHEIYYNITGSVVGYSGDGSGLTVSFYDKITSDLLFSVTTVIGGTFSAVWYDNTRDIVCDVYDTGLNKYAKSPPGLAGVAPFVCNLNSGTTSYAFL